jgi:hypothetical protein
MKNRLREEIREKDPTTVILFLMDNSVYYGCLEDGSNVAARRHTDGNYHIEGEVAVWQRNTATPFQHNEATSGPDWEEERYSGDTNAALHSGWLLLKSWSLLKQEILGL